jgi:hypothetical protein
VRKRDGGPVVADDPFAETKEQIAAFYVLECKELDEALEIASMNPGCGVRDCSRSGRLGWASRLRTGGPRDVP